MGEALKDPLNPPTTPGSVLITGGAGFIGAGLATRLHEAGRRVIVVDNLHPQVHTRGCRPERLHPGVPLLPFDVSHREGWDALFCLERPDVVVHLAAETGTGQSMREATRHGMVNVVGTTQLLDALARAEHLPAQLLLASSRAVYGEGMWRSDAGVNYSPGVRDLRSLEAGQWDPPAPDGAVGLPIPSRAGVTEPRPTSIYAATKLAQEHLLSSWGAAMGCPVTVLRLQNVYGPGQTSFNSYTGVLAAFARRTVSGEPIDVYEDGRIVRDFVHVEDVLDAFEAVLRAPAKNQRLIDIGSGRPETLIAVARTMAKLAGAPDPIISGRFRVGDVRAAACDIEDARREFGYKPQWQLERGLSGLLEWIGTHET